MSAPEVKSLVFRYRPSAFSSPNSSAERSPTGTRTGAGLSRRQSATCSSTASSSGRLAIRPAASSALGHTRGAGLAAGPAVSRSTRVTQTGSGGSTIASQPDREAADGSATRDTTASSSSARRNLPRAAGSPTRLRSCPCAAVNSSATRIRLFLAAATCAARRAARGDSGWLTSQPSRPAPGHPIGDPRARPGRRRSRCRPGCSGRPRRRGCSGGPGCHPACCPAG